MINTLSKINLSKIRQEGGRSTLILIMSTNILVFFLEVTPKGKKLNHLGKKTQPGKKTRPLGENLTIGEENSTIWGKIRPWGKKTRPFGGKFDHWGRKLDHLGKKIRPFGGKFDHWGRISTIWGKTRPKQHWGKNSTTCNYIHPWGGGGVK